MKYCIRGCGNPVKSSTGYCTACQNFLEKMEEDQKHLSFLKELRGMPKEARVVRLGEIEREVYGQNFHW